MHKMRFQISKQINHWSGGFVTVGLASHWLCVTDNSGITIYGLMALEREMSTPPIPSRSVAQFTLVEASYNYITLRTVLICYSVTIIRF